MAKGSSGSMFLAAAAAAELLFMQVLGYRRLPDAHFFRRAAILSGVGWSAAPAELSLTDGTLGAGGGTW